MRDAVEIVMTPPPKYQIFSPIDLWWKLYWRGQGSLEESDQDGSHPINPKDPDTIGLLLLAVCWEAYRIGALELSPGLYSLTLVA